MNRDAAIEAGARVLHEQWQTSMGVPPGVVTFDDESESLKELIRQQAAAVIDAAAPHLVGQPVGYALTWGGWVSPVRLDSAEDVASYRERTGMSGVTVALVPIEDQP